LRCGWNTSLEFHFGDLKYKHQQEHHASETNGKKR